MILLLLVIIIFTFLAFYKILHAQSTPVSVEATSTIVLDTKPLEKAIQEASVTPTELIERYSQQYDVNTNLALRIANCEGGLASTTIKNKHSSASGIYQWLDSSYRVYATKYGFPLNEKNNPKVQIEMSMIVMRDEGEGNWSASYECWS